MDAVYYYIAIACFAVAVICAVAAIIIFFRAGVPDAVRFLRHKPMKGASGSKPRTTPSRSGRLRAARKVSGGPVVASGMDSTNSDLIAPPDDRTTTSRGKHAPGKTRRVSGRKPSVAVPPVPSVDPVAEGASKASSTDQAASRASKVEASEDPTDILSGSAAGAYGAESYEGETSEDPTGLLAGDEETESPTGMLAEDDSENPTGLLDDGEASENPTGVLDDGESESPTGMLVDDGETEDPTGMLVEHEDSEDPTGLLGSEPMAAAEVEVGPTAEVAAESEAGSETAPAVDPEPADELPAEASAADEEPDDLEDPDSPTRMLAAVPVEDGSDSNEDNDDVAQLDEDEFRFIIKQNIIVVHTDEVIEG